LLNLAWQLENFHRLGTAGTKSQDHEISAAVQTAAGAAPDSPTHAPPPLSKWAPEFAQLVDLVDSLWVAPSRSVEIAAQATDVADRLRTATLERLARQLHAAGIKKAASAAEHG